LYFCCQPFFCESEHIKRKVLCKKTRELLWAEDGFFVKLRCDNYFDPEEYAEIKQTLLENLEVWKKTAVYRLMIWPL